MKTKTGAALVRAQRRAQEAASRTVIRTMTVTAVDTVNNVVTVDLDGESVDIPAQSGYLPEVGHVVNILMNGDAPSAAAPPSGPMTSDPPEQVTGVTVSPGIRALIVEWDEVADEDVRNARGTYEINVDTDNAFPSPRIFIAAGNAMVVTDLDIGTTYYVRVRAIDQAGEEGPWSATGSGTPDEVTEVEIADDSISAPKLQANSVIAGKIAANAVIAGTVDADAITGRELDVIEIEVNKDIHSGDWDPGVAGFFIGDLSGVGYAEFNNVVVRGLFLASQATLVEGAQLLPNGTFDTDTAGWTGNNCTLARDTTTKRTGAGSLKMTTSSAADMFAYTAAGTSGIPVIPGATYAAKAFYRTAVTAESCFTIIRWYDSSGAFISDSEFDGTVGTLDATSTWAGDIAIQDAPSNAAYAALKLLIEAAANGEVHYVDDVEFFRASNITGGVFKTASDGKRLELTQSQIRLYFGRDDEEGGYIYASEFGSQGSLFVRSPRYGTDDPAQLILYSEGGGAVSQARIQADDFRFVPSNDDALRVRISQDNAATNPEDIALASGWTPAYETWTYASADTPTYTFTVAADVTTKYSPGMRVKFTQSSTVKYGIITAVSTYSGGNTTITVLMSMTSGTVDNSGLANSAISANYYSVVKAPQGFPASPLRWTVELTDTTQRTQTNPTANTWYNVGSLSLSVPIGVWDLSFGAIPGTTKNPSTVASAFVALSTANNSASDGELKGNSYVQVIASGNAVYLATVSRSKIVALAAKTTYYLNAMTDIASCSALELRNERATASIRAVCAYL